MIATDRTIDRLAARRRPRWQDRGRPHEPDPPRGQGGETRADRLDRHAARVRRDLERYEAEPETGQRLLF